MNFFGLISFGVKPRPRCASPYGRGNLTATKREMARLAISSNFSFQLCSAPYGHSTRKTETSFSCDVIRHWATGRKKTNFNKFAKSSIIMQVILYMATTVNGYIAKENNETPWSDEEWQSFSKFVKEIKNIVIGKNTYEIMKKDDEFSKIGNPFTVVVSKEDFAHNYNFTIAKSPKEALKILKEKNFTKALVAGGGMLNSSFMKEKLVDEIYLDVEPLIFGKGIKLFSDNDFDAKLELMGTKSLSKNTIQLHYKILK